MTDPVVVALWFGAAIGLFGAVAARTYAEPRRDEGIGRRILRARCFELPPRARGHSLAESGAGRRSGM